MTAPDPLTELTRLGEEQHLLDLIHRLKTRAQIRRQISTRKSVAEGKPDRIADLLEEAAQMLAAFHRDHFTPEGRAFRIDTLFDAIAHGDADHRAWLKEKLGEHFS